MIFLKKSQSLGPQGGCATDEKAMMLRFHTQTGGSTLTAQQPMNNIIRVTNQAMAAVLGGTQSLHTNGYDEALSLPTEAAAKIALRTQQVIAFESGVTNTVDPLAGSYFVEALTDEIESAAMSYMEKIDAMGGSVSAIENGYIQQEIASSAYQYQKEVEGVDRIIVGVNKFQQETEAITDTLQIDESIRKIQTEKLEQLKLTRNNDAVNIALKNLKNAAHSDQNLMPFILVAIEEYATLGEIADCLRKVFGEY
jgi:methylmalonyl-CoA mutase N-terminal domain/subunit